MSKKNWRIYKRRGSFFRRRAIRGEQYDSSRWTLVKGYDSEDDARKALKVLEDRYTFSDGFKTWQIKLVAPNETLKNRE